MFEMCRSFCFRIFFYNLKTQVQFVSSVSSKCTIMNTVSLMEEIATDVDMCLPLKVIVDTQQMSDASR